MSTVFIYHLDGMSKVLDAEKARESHLGLLSNGWKHTATLEPCVWLEYILSLKGDDLLTEIQSLTTKPHHP